MNILKLLNNPELKDIPILYVIRVVHVIQKELLNEQPSVYGSKLFEPNESVKE